MWLFFHCCKKYNVHVLRLEHYIMLDILWFDINNSTVLVREMKMKCEALTLPGRGIHSLWPDGERGSGSRDWCRRKRWPWPRSLCRPAGGWRSSTTAWWQRRGSSAPPHGEPRPWRSYSQWLRSRPSAAAPAPTGLHWLDCVSLATIRQLIVLMKTDLLCSKLTKWLR